MYVSSYARVTPVVPLLVMCKGREAAVSFTVTHFADSRCKDCPPEMMKLTQPSAFGRTTTMLKKWYDRPTDWIFKLDDDTWLHTPELAAAVCRMKPSDPYYGGFLMDYQGEMFASGGSGYLLSSETMRRAAFRERCQEKFPYEDVGVAKCLAKIGVTPKDLPGVHPDTPEKMLEWCITPSSDHRSHHCEGVFSAITYHYVSPGRVLRWTPGRRFPKRIHQIWLSNHQGTSVREPPPLELIRTCSELHPDWEYTLWDEEAVAKLTSDSIYQNDGSWTALTEPV